MIRTGSTSNDECRCQHTGRSNECKTDGCQECRIHCWCCSLLSSLEIFLSIQSVQFSTVDDVHSMY